ncbi:MAG TPA: PTS system mannose/fructose/sorbose family transporter subunit IID [Gemmatimonadaceae bacterium]|nr:PTS system mannose/fructose/sorbose family transporter subunit IID [Gemmatimonadaceae bacterium]
MPPRIPARTWLAIFARLFAVQGSWNYELLVGTGIGFCTEPALRELPGGRTGAAYHDAVARESRYFNAHPYLAAMAVGALVRAELEGEPAERIERFRTALCGPLGSVGDRLVWAGWLPMSSLLALTVFGLGASAWVTVLIFLGVYNIGQLGLRAWGLRAGWRYGTRTAQALANPVLRHGPPYLARAVALLAGIALPLTIQRVLGVMTAPLSRVAGTVATIPIGIGVLVAATLVATGLAAVLMTCFRGRIEGWRLALVVLVALTIYSIA